MISSRIVKPMRMPESCATNLRQSSSATGIRALPAALRHPGASGQGRTIPEALHSPAEAISPILEDRREDALRGMPREAIREVVIEKSGEVIFHFKDAPRPVPAARARHLPGSAAAPYGVGSWSGHGGLFTFFRRPLERRFVSEFGEYGPGKR